MSALRQRAVITPIWRRSRCSKKNWKLSERHFLAAAARAVDGVDDFERIITFLSADKRLSSVLDRLPKIEELFLEWLEGNGHGIGSAGRHIAIDGRGRA